MTKTQTRMISWGGTCPLSPISHHHHVVVTIITTETQDYGTCLRFFSPFVLNPPLAVVCRVTVDFGVVKQAHVLDEVRLRCAFGTRPMKQLADFNIVFKILNPR